MYSVVRALIFLVDILYLMHLLLIIIYYSILYTFTQTDELAQQSWGKEGRDAATQMFREIKCNNNKSSDTLWRGWTTETKTITE